MTIDAEQPSHHQISSIVGSENYFHSSFAESLVKRIFTEQLAHHDSASWINPPVEVDCEDSRG